MISVAEANGSFPALAKQYKRLVHDFFLALPIKPKTLPLSPTDDAFNSGMRPDILYVVKGGMLGMRCEERKLFIWDEGDLILPDASGEDVSYYAESSALLAAYSTTDVMAAVTRDPQLAKLWTHILVTQQGMLVRLLAAYSPEESHTTTGFAYFDAGQTIIQQGEPANYVLSLFEGSADVLVDGVTVGHVTEGEIIGAIAVLTDAPRNATVKANSRCAVIKVPKSQFKDLIRTNPGMIHALLQDMAKQITRLNQQVVELSS